MAAKPEEIVRQTFIRHLIDHYGYSLAQMDQERRTQHGHKSPRADIVIWETPEKKANNNTPVLVVECKSEGVDINVKDYYQGESYTRAVGCEFFIAHNTRFTAVFNWCQGCRAISSRSTKSPERRTGATPSASRRSRTGSGCSTARNSRTYCSSATRSCATFTRWSRGARSTPSRKSCS